MLITRINPATHGHNVLHSRFALEILCIFCRFHNALTSWEIASLVSPIEVDFGTRHEHHKLPSCVFLSLRSSCRNQDGCTTNFTLEALAIHAAWEPSHTHLKATPGLINISIIQRACVENAEGLAVPEKLTHIS